MKICIWIKWIVWNRKIPPYEPSRLFKVSQENLFHQIFKVKSSSSLWLLTLKIIKTHRKNRLLIIVKSTKIGKRWIQSNFGWWDFPSYWSQPPLSEIADGKIFSAYVSDDFKTKKMYKEICFFICWKKFHKIFFVINFFFQHFIFLQNSKTFFEHTFQTILKQKQFF